MQLNYIISMANLKVRLRFLAMERSLRATGCQLPLRVIPYDDQRFDLPEGSAWWETPEVTGWLQHESAHPTMRKYQCLTISNYQFVDADVCFLRHPESVLEPHSGFITSCGHWHNPAQTYTPESQHYFAQQTTTWQQNVFNTGQFACDRSLYTVEELKAATHREDFVATCLRHPSHEQPGVNLLVAASGVKITNVTLPSTAMESTWAGDYPTDYERYWNEEGRKPYLIHWAGVPMDTPRPINSIFYNFLTREEKAEWDEQTRLSTQARHRSQRSMRAVARRFKNAFRTFREG
jgi:hypothetical protein